MTGKAQIRLALRREGEFWNAYLALPDTMEGAKLIGSIVLGPAERDPLIKEGFITLMSAVMADAIKRLTGQEMVDFTIQDAPESERSGHG